MSGLRKKASEATERTVKTSHSAQSGPSQPRALRTPTRIAPAPKKMAKKPPGVVTSATSRTRPPSTQIHQAMAHLADAPRASG